MIYTIERKIEFDAGHRLVGHGGKCAYLHGHRYVVHVFARTRTGFLDDVGRVIDFSIIKEGLGVWIDKLWDHNLILNREDAELAVAVRRFCKGGAPYLLPYNPTAENLGHYLLEEICPQVFALDPIEVTMIKVDETPNCSAIVQTEKEIH